MKLVKAIIPMAGSEHRELSLKQLTTDNGSTKHVVTLHVEELFSAGIEQVALIVHPRPCSLLLDLVAQFGPSVAVISQEKPGGFGESMLHAEDWVANEPFALKRCDHMFVTHAVNSCTRQLIDVATREGCAVSVVQVIDESQLAHSEVICGYREGGDDHLYAIDSTIDKPSPTVAEQRCMVPGLRQGKYLAFSGIHALTPAVFDCLRARQSTLREGQSLNLTESLALLATRERYRALELRGCRLNLGVPFGVLRAQLALALHGARREEVLRIMLEEVARTEAEKS